MEIIVGPFLLLEAMFSGQKLLLKTGEPFEVFLSIAHEEMNVGDASIVALSLEFSNQYLSALPTASYTTSSGESGVYGM